MNIWIILIFNALLGTDAIITYYYSLDIINQILSGARITITLLTIFI